MNFEVAPLVKKNIKLIYVHTMDLEEKFAVCALF
jgi:hypothetical protein